MKKPNKKITKKVTPADEIEIEKDILNFRICELVKEFNDKTGCMVEDILFMSYSSGREGKQKKVYKPYDVLIALPFERWEK